MDGGPVSDYENRDILSYSITELFGQWSWVRRGSQGQLNCFDGLRRWPLIYLTVEADYEEIRSTL